MPDWLIWFLIGVGLIAFEAVAAFTLYAGAVAFGAFPAAIVAAFDASPPHRDASQHREGEASKVWIVPPSVIDAARRLGDAADGLAGGRPAP